MGRAILILSATYAFYVIVAQPLSDAFLGEEACDDLQNGVASLLQISADGFQELDREHRQSISQSTCPHEFGGGETNCYKDTWAYEMMQNDGIGDKVFMDVGCNTGVDAVAWLERWGSHSNIVEAWKNELEKQGIGDGACGENKQESRSDRVFKPSVSGSRTRPRSRVFCVEPMPSTANMLKQISSAVLKEISPTSFTVIHAAVSNDTGVVQFPVGQKGQEDLGIDRKESHSVADVRMLTVDELMVEYELKSLDVLTIDVEGHDPLVLQGAKKTLASGNIRYLAFEVHQDLDTSPWAKTTLLSQIQLLDDFEFDCYWAGNNGKLSRLTGCWNEEEERNHAPLKWSNVVCARRGDEWQAILEKYTREP